jgi:hypothetical protein
MKQGGQVRSKIDNDTTARRVDTIHVGNLAASFRDVVLVDADGVDPEHPNAAPWPYEAQHFPAILCLN